MRDRINRRDFVISAATLAGGVALGCTDTNDPDPELPSLDHIIVVTMENRSFDHLLGWVPGANGRPAGLSYRDLNGVAHSPQHLTRFDSCGLADPNHSFQGGRQEYNNGALDGWLKADGNDLYA